MEKTTFRLPKIGLKYSSYHKLVIFLLCHVSVYTWACYGVGISGIWRVRHRRLHRHACTSTAEIWWIISRTRGCHPYACHDRTPVPSSVVCSQIFLNLIGIDFVPTFQNIHSVPWCWFVLLISSQIFSTLVWIGIVYSYLPKYSVVWSGFVLLQPSPIFSTLVWIRITPTIPNIHYPGLDSYNSYHP